MAHDPVRVADTKAWMAKADGDLRAGAHELTAVPPFTGDAAFHAQQAVEKALKGFLFWHDFRSARHMIWPKWGDNAHRSTARLNRFCCGRRN